MIQKKSSKPISLTQPYTDDLVVKTRDPMREMILLKMIRTKKSFFVY